jgi:hypothetical protein
LPIHQNSHRVDGLAWYSEDSGRFGGRAIVSAKIWSDQPDGVAAHEQLSIAPVLRKLLSQDLCASGVVARQPIRFHEYNHGWKLSEIVNPERFVRLSSTRSAKNS